MTQLITILDNFYFFLSISTLFYQTYLGTCERVYTLLKLRRYWF